MSVNVRLEFLGVPEELSEWNVYEKLQSFETEHGACMVSMSARPMVGDLIFMRSFFDNNVFHWRAENICDRMSIKWRVMEVMLYDTFLDVQVAAIKDYNLKYPS